MSIIGVCPISNNMSLEVLDIEYGIEDRVVYRYSNDTRTRKARVYYGPRSTYFRTGMGRISLDNVIRV